MRKSGLIFAVAASLCMTACGSTIPDMTEEQEAMIVEYAAGLLLKYDKNYHGRLLEDEELAEAEQKEAEKRERMLEEEARKAAEAAETAKETTEVVDVSEEPETITYRSIEEFYGIDGVAIRYAGYELKDMYSDSGGDDIFFAMNASAGSKLVVLHFDVENVSGQDMELDMLSLETKFKISFNGETPKYALTTMLTNDLASYKGTIAAGSSEPLVLVAELQEDKAQSIQTMSLMMRNGTEEATISLN